LALAKLTYESDAAQRQRIKEDFLRDVLKFETEFKEAQLTETPASDARH